MGLSSRSEDLIADARDWARNTGVLFPHGARLVDRLADALEVAEKRATEAEAELLYETRTKEAALAGLGRYEKLLQKVEAERDAALAVIEKVRELLGDLDLDSSRITAPGTAWGSLLREAREALNSPPADELAMSPEHVKETAESLHFPAEPAVQVEPTEIQVRDALEAYLNHDGRLRDAMRAALRFVAVGDGEAPPWGDDRTCPTCGEPDLPLQDSTPPGLSFISHCGGAWARGPIKTTAPEGGRR